MIEAPPERVWQLVSDPHNLPRWWPRTRRVEDVRGSGSRTRWTMLLGTERGSGVRADFRCTHSTHGRRIGWEQDVAGTPFERILRTARTDVELEPAGSGSTSVRLCSDERLRGLSRLGSPMMRGAARRRLDEALDGIEYALVGESA